MSKVFVMPWIENNRWWVRFAFNGSRNNSDYEFAYVSKRPAYFSACRYTMHIAQDIYNERRPFLMLDVSRPTYIIEEAKQKLDEIIVEKYGDILLTQERLDRLQLLI